MLPTDARVNPAGRTVTSTHRVVAPRRVRDGRTTRSPARSAGPGSLAARVGRESRRLAAGEERALSRRWAPLRRCSARWSARPRSTRS